MRILFLALWDSVLWSLLWYGLHSGRRLSFVNFGIVGFAALFHLVQLAWTIAAPRRGKGAA